MYEVNIGAHSNLATRALRKAFFFGVPISVAAFFLGSPHYGPGGYFSLLGLTVLWPFYWLGESTNLFAESNSFFWLISIFLQCLWMFCFFVVFDLFLMVVRRKAKSD